MFSLIFLERKKNILEIIIWKLLPRCIRKFLNPSFYDSFETSSRVYILKMNFSRSFNYIFFKEIILYYQLKKISKINQIFAVFYYKRVSKWFPFAFVWLPRMPWQTQSGVNFNEKKEPAISLIPLFASSALLPILYPILGISKCWI